jgi:hypothetical protein
MSKIGKELFKSLTYKYKSEIQCNLSLIIYIIFYLISFYLISF